MKGGVKSESGEEEGGRSRWGDSGREINKVNRRTLRDRRGERRVREEKRLEAKPRDVDGNGGPTEGGDERRGGGEVTRGGEEGR